MLKLSQGIIMSFAGMQEALTDMGKTCNCAAETNGRKIRQRNTSLTGFVVTPAIGSHWQAAKTMPS